jgi:uncharacterized membrane protein YfcA
MVTLISAGAAFFSGLLGIGGGVILIPAYLYLFPFLGYDVFSVNAITGITATQATAGGYFAFRNHSKFQPIDKKLAFNVALFAVPAAFIGTLISKFLTDKQLLIVYLLILAIAAVGVIIPEHISKNPEADYTTKHPVFANITTFVTTAISSAMGFGGAINFIPILNHFYNMPIRLAISTVTFLILLTTSVTLLGKLFLGLVPFKLMPFIILGSALGAKIGTNINQKLSTTNLKLILLLVIIVIWIRIFITVLQK